MSSFSDSVFDKIYLLAVEGGCLLWDIQTLEIVDVYKRQFHECPSEHFHHTLCIECLDILFGEISLFFS